MSSQRISIKNTVFELERPKVCPHCHIANFPSHRYQDLTLSLDGQEGVISIWQCMNSDCRRIIVTEHQFNGNQLPINQTLNGLPKGPDWPVPIVDLCKPDDEDVESKPSKFIKIYLQSLHAEHLGLDELAGMGYRKAIEHLVKDWAISKTPEDRENIENSWLGAVIKKYYSGDLEDILERATWLGNDQAHYKRLFDEFDVNVLKELIDLILVELDREFKKRHYIETIEKRK